MKTESILRVAYLVNQYPKVSHSFIRREILALEHAGVQVERIALRGWNAVVADPADERERERTKYILQSGALRLILATLRTLLAKPGKFFQALRLAYRRGRTADRSALHPFVCLVEACRLLDLVRAARVSHVHAHFGTNGAEVALLAHRLGGPPYSFTVHGPEEFDRPDLLGIREKVAASKFVVAVSSYGSSQLYRCIAPGDWNKVKVVHCGLDGALLSRAPAPLQASPTLVCVGRLSAQKGQLLLIEAAAKLAQKRMDFDIVLAGDGELRSRIQEAIKAKGLDSHVRITGWISGERVLEEIEAARALVLPSFAEGLPVVIMEAMAAGRPVLSTSVAGIPELVRDGREGWLVPAGDVDALAERMEAVLNAPLEELERMGNAARERVRERHSIDASAAALAYAFAENAEQASMA
jgi:glycosyltransferase involved in cell wall biosynthesis